MNESQSLSPEQLVRISGYATDFAREGRTAELSEFLDHGLQVDFQDDAGNTFLMLAAYSGQADTVEMLLARGADANTRNARDQSPVAGAMFKGEDAIVAHLIAAGADLEAGTPSARATAAMFGREHLLP